MIQAKKTAALKRLIFRETSWHEKHEVFQPQCYIIKSTSDEVFIICQCGWKSYSPNLNTVGQTLR